MCALLLCESTFIEVLTIITMADTYGQTDIRRDEQTDRQTNRETDRGTGRLTKAKGSREMKAKHKIGLHYNEYVIPYTIKHFLYEFKIVLIKNFQFRIDGKEGGRKVYSKIREDIKKSIEIFLPILMYACSTRRRDRQTCRQTDEQADLI